MIKVIALLLFSLLLSSCASIFHSERQSVTFKGGIEKGNTKILSRDGTFEVELGAGTYMMSRSKPDIQLKVICPDGTMKSIIAPTRYTWELGWLNVFTWGLGFFDALADSAYTTNDVSLMGICPSPSVSQK